MDMCHNLDLTLIPKELKLALEIIKAGQEGNKNIDDDQKEEFFNWNFFLELVIHHRLHPILHYYLKRVNTYNLIPTSVIKEIAMLYKLNTLQMLQLRAEMELVGDLLKNNNISLLFLKGPILALDLYGDVSLRTSCDLDVLVSFDDLDKTEEILLAQGYRKDEYIQTVLGDWKWRHHHFTYHHPVKNIKIEVHWRLNPGPGKEPSFKILWERKRKLTNSKTPLNYLSKEDLVFFLITHGARHGWSRLRWLMDVHQSITQGIDWGILGKMVQKYGHINSAGQALYLSSQIFGTKIPKSLKSLLIRKKSRKISQTTVYYLEKMINLHSETLPIDVSKYHKNYLLSLMSLENKLLFALSCLFPYPTDLQTLPLPKYFHFLYFPLRPFLWIWRKARGQAVT